MSLFPALRSGHRGPAVATLQALLGVGADGIFGAQTEALVRAYQAQQGLVADGIVGAQTWASLWRGAPYAAPVECPPGQSLPLIGYRRQHGRPGQTWAVDLPVPVGSPLASPCAGAVVRVSDADDPNNGVGVWIRPDRGPLRQIAMIHLSLRGVEVGARVVEGEPIGATGNTGASTGPHLHLEVAPELDPLLLFRWPERGW